MNTITFRKLLDSAFRTPGRTQAVNMALMGLKRRWYIDGAGLSAAEEQWLITLAMRGGWTATAATKPKEKANA